MINIIEDSIKFLEKYKSKLDENSSSYYRIDIILPVLSKIKSSETEWSKICQYLYSKYKIYIVNVHIYLESIFCTWSHMTLMNIDLEWINLA